MLWAINAMWIKGLMFGLEYADHPNGMFTVCIDLGILRLVYYRGPEEAWDEDL